MAQMHTQVPANVRELLVFVTSPYTKEGLTREIPVPGLLMGWEIDNRPKGDLSVPPGWVDSDWEFATKVRITVWTEGSAFSALVVTVDNWPHRNHQIVGDLGFRKTGGPPGWEHAGWKKRTAA